LRLPLSKKVQDLERSGVNDSHDVTLSQAAEYVRAAASATIVTHRNPDGDAIGSAVALAGAMRSLGKQVRIVCPDRLPEYLLSVPGARDVSQDLGDDPTDLLIAIDVSDPALLHPLACADPLYFQQRKSLNLDHHYSNLRYASYNHVDASAASATEIVGALIHEYLGVAYSVDLATDLLYGVVNDTHSFQNSNTTSRTLRFSADLVDAGADLSRIVFNLLLEKESASARLWAEALPTLDFADNERVASLTVTLDALKRSASTMTGADGLVEFLRNIRGIDLAVLYKQTAPDTYRLSLRSSAAVDATKVAAAFGGGGHQRAAGGEAKGRLDEIKSQLLAAYTAARED
jgi:bifunctional oligoribonuclease and PAP phosphatase NrnA